MAVLGTKEGAKKPWKKGQMGISVRRHEDAWYEDLAELALETGLKTLAAVGGFAVGGPAGAMAAASAAGYVKKVLTGEETIPADITGQLAYLVSSGYEKLQGEDKSVMSAETEEEKAKAKYAGAPDVPADIPQGSYVHKDGNWVEAPAGSTAASAVPGPAAPPADVQARLMDLNVPSTAPGPYVPNLQPPPVPTQTPLQTRGLSGVQSMVPGLQQQAWSAPSQLEVQATLAADQFMEHLKSMQSGHAGPYPAMTKPGEGY